jgi:trk system potassium uptake protein TrkH
MKIRIVLDVLGLLLVLLGLLMMVPAAVAAIYKEPAGVIALGLSSFITVATGLILKHIGQKGEVTHREAFAIVAFGWLLATFFGALPFAFLGLGAIDSLFESMSGFTTTGATILTESDLQGYWIINSTAADNSLAYYLVNTLFNSLKGYSSGTDGIAILSLGINANAESTFYGLLFWRAFTQL